MRKKTTRSAAWMLIGSLVLGCSGGRASEIAPLLLREQAPDPLAGAPGFAPWRPPRQMAAFVYAHEDLEQGVMIAGHWILVLLGEGSWYFQEPEDREPVPDAEATAEDVRNALGAVLVPQDAVVPFRAKEGEKP